LARCVYCLTDFDKLTTDHILPRSWYPKTTPESLEKYQAPVCNECNNKYSRIEAELLTVFALCTPPNTEATDGVIEPVMRSLKPQLASTDRERHHRIKKIVKLQRNMRTYKDCQSIPHNAIYPNFGIQSDLEYEQYDAVFLNKENLESFLEKVIRGLTYRLNNQYIEQSHCITTYLPTVETENIFEPILQQWGEIFERGKGVTIIRAIPADDPVSSVWKIILWERFITYSAVSPVE
jgi:hypothetical protein